MWVLSISAAVVALPSAAAFVPLEFRDLFAELDGALTRFERRLAAEWDGTRGPVVYSADLSVADSHRVRALMDAHPVGFEKHLDALAALGIGAVTVNISLPVLHPSFHRSAAEYDAFLSFYRRMAADVRRRRLRLIVKTQALVPGADPGIGPFYESIGSLEDYRLARIHVARVIAREIAPDVMTVQMEPDVEGYVTGQRLDSASAAAMVEAIADAVRRENPRVYLGAGAGTWYEPWSEHLDRLTRIRSLDFIDLHVYPASRDYLDRILDAADLAAARGKRIGVSEAWLFKVRDSELAYAPLLATHLAARDAFGFWAPLDQRFLDAIVAAAHHKRFAFVSPFWSKYFFAYLNYAEAGSFDAPALIAASTAAAAQAVFASDISETGIRYRQLTGFTGR